LGRLLTLLRNLLRPSDFASMHQQVNRATDLVYRADADIKQFFLAIAEFLDGMREGQPMGTYTQQIRVIPSTRNQPNWMDVEMAWETASETLNLLLSLCGHLHTDLNDLGEALPEEVLDSLGAFGTVLRRLKEADTYITALISEPDHQFIYWIEQEPNNARIAL